MPQNNSIESLYNRYLANELNEAELSDFLQRLHDPANEAIVSQLMEGTWKEMYEVKEPAVTETEPRVVPMYQRTAFKWIAAACIILLLGIGTYVTLSGDEGRHKEQPVATTHDVPAPTNTRAVITLADGSKVYLDSAGNGTIAQENNVAVVKNSDGSIIYSHGDTKTQTAIAYNTLFNPRGSKVISLTLSDGTKVWLNSESSLRYPASFAATALNREVEITGEAYFEVKHNSKQPFKVHLPNGSVIEDIGTAFNVNAYTDESNIKTTLVEGSVAVTLSPVEGSQRKVIKPGEQAVVDPTNHSLLTTSSVDLDEVLAWKNGRFTFNGTGIETIMRQVARWYDVEIVYETKPADTFFAEIPRDTKASDVLKALELTNKVHFKIEGKKITVMK